MALLLNGDSIDDFSESIPADITDFEFAEELQHP